MSKRTLEQWRWQGKGPRFLKIGGRVVYPVPEVEAYEAASLHANTNGPVGSQIDDDQARDRRKSIPGARRAAGDADR